MRPSKKKVDLRKTIYPGIGFIPKYEDSEDGD